MESIVTLVSTLEAATEVQMLMASEVQMSLPQVLLIAVKTFEMNHFPLDSSKYILIDLK